MITALDIRERAGEWGLSPDVVEKDYVLGWLLAAIGADPVLGRTFIFKGGTCLKKCYFETYRFSEDLDFTLVEGAPADAEALTVAFSRVAQRLQDVAGLELPPSQFRFEVYQNPRGRPSIEGRVYYRGPLPRPAGNMPRVKLDLTADEVVVRPPVLRPVWHPYPDAEAMGRATVRSYSYDELFGEKMRALIERTRPRDLYDVVNMFRYEPERPAATAVVDAYRAKCEFKGIEAPLTVDGLLPERHLQDLEADWAPMLSHQLPELPTLDQFVAALAEVAAWLGGAPIPVLPPVPVRGPVSTWAAPPMIDTWHAGFAVELIRFAGRNRLCIDLDYGGKTRLVEPYSFRRSQPGDLLFFGWNVPDGEIRSYRADRIAGVRVTNRPFAPRFAVEF
jgi:predicted nucleotidyltransferase component of viral defense system